MANLMAHLISTKSACRELMSNVSPVSFDRLTYEESSYFDLLNMTTLMMVGVIFVVCSNISLSVPIKNISCQWLCDMDGVLAIIAPIPQSYRASRVFPGEKLVRAVTTNDKMLI